MNFQYFSTVHTLNNEPAGLFLNILSILSFFIGITFYVVA